MTNASCNLLDVDKEINHYTHVRDVRRIIGSKMSARDTEEFCMYSMIAGKGGK